MSQDWHQRSLAIFRDSEPRVKREFLTASPDLIKLRRSTRHRCFEQAWECAKTTRSSRTESVALHTLRDTSASGVSVSRNRFTISA